MNSVPTTDEHKGGEHKGGEHRVGTVDSLLGRMGPWLATIVLTLAAVLAALGTLLLYALLGGPPVTWRVVTTATMVTVVVGAPVILYSQRIIRKLRSSRRALKDVTSRLAIALDHAEEANRAKSTFLANMSHELRTPLNAIIGFSEMIRDQHLGPVGNGKYLAYAGDIHVSGTHLLKIINEILDLSKIEAGQMSMAESSEFDLDNALDSVLRILRPLADRASVALVCEAPPLPIRLFAVERMIQQIAINVVTNAIKFTPPGGSVSLAHELNADGSYALIVRDTGLGMTREEMSRALVPFGQIENAMNRKHHGTGLGLPLSKAMMELHDGALNIRSEPQHGTTVRLLFPRSRVRADYSAAAPQRAMTA